MTARWGLLDRNGWLVGRVAASWERPPGSELLLVPPEEADAAPVPPPYAPPQPDPPEPVRRLVPLAVVMMRLKLLGREQALLDLLNAPGNEHARDELMEQVEQGIYADDPQARTLIALAGADPDRILA
jgi:hypothetical protein